MRPRYGYWLAGRACDEGAWLEVRDKFTGESLTEVATASPAAIERAIQPASQAREPLRRMAAVLGFPDASNAALTRALDAAAGARTRVV